MRHEQTSCFYRGNTFYGDFAVAGVGSDQEVVVRYRGEQISAKAKHDPADVVARKLLEELVMLESIAQTVCQASGVRTTSIHAEARYRDMS